MLLLSLSETSIQPRTSSPKFDQPTLEVVDCGANRGPRVWPLDLSLSKEELSLRFKLLCSRVTWDSMSSRPIVDGVRILWDGVAWPVATTSRRLTPVGASDFILRYRWLITIVRKLCCVKRLGEKRRTPRRAPCTPDPSVGGLSQFISFSMCYRTKHRAHR